MDMIIQSVLPLPFLDDSEANQRRDSFEEDVE